MLSGRCKNPASASHDLPRCHVRPHPPAKEAQAKARLLLKTMGVTDDGLMQGEARGS